MGHHMSGRCAWHFQPVSDSFGFIFAMRNSYLSLLRSYLTASSFAMAPPLLATVSRNKHAARACTLPILTSAIKVSAGSLKVTLCRWIPVQTRRILISLEHCQLLAGQFCSCPRVFPELWCCFLELSTLTKSPTAL